MSNLFTAVSVEQQETVAGGTLAALNSTIFTRQLVTLGVVGFSGPTGSGGSTLGSTERTATGQVTQIADGLTLISPALFPAVPNPFV
jgi:hypothetical protein